MKKYKSLIYLSLATVAIGCSDKKIDFNINTSSLKQHYINGESLTLEILNPTNTAIDSVVYYINETKTLVSKSGKASELKFNNEKFGDKIIKGLVYYDGGKTSEVSASVTVISSIEPQIIDYEILNTYSHDMYAYTQGLEFYRDTLFESTGQYGSSTLRKTDAKTGKIFEKINLEGKYFGEGLTVLNNKVYQLTWQEKTGFIYNADTFKKEREFTYFDNIEGWGLCNDGTHIYMSDGTEKIWKLDPETLKPIDFINVFSKSSKVRGINELEWIDGKIYANVYTMDAIAIIDPNSGAIEKVINLSNLKSFVTNHDKLDVLNGIAYNKNKKTIFITGKNWDKMFEIITK